MAEDPLVQAMELFSGFGLILAFLVFTRLAIKAKSTGSFRFQLSIFMLIWVMAEIPRVGNTLGIISTVGFGLYGLIFHMISMFAFTLFVGAKSYLFLRTPSMPSLPAKTTAPKTTRNVNRRITIMSQPGFDDIVEGSVREAMSRVLGTEVWKAVSFYFDVKTVSREPKSFEKLLGKLFGGSSKVLQQVIGETLLSKVGSTPDRIKGREFQDWIIIARAKFSSAGKHYGSEKVARISPDRPKSAGQVGSRPQPLRLFGRSFQSPPVPEVAGYEVRKPWLPLLGMRWRGRRRAPFLRCKPRVRCQRRLLSSGRLWLPQ